MRIDCPTRIYWWNGRTFAYFQIESIRTLFTAQFWLWSSFFNLYKTSSWHRVTFTCLDLFTEVTATHYKLFGRWMWGGAFFSKKQNWFAVMRCKSGRSVRLHCRLEEGSLCQPCNVHHAKMASANLQMTPVRHLGPREEDLTLLPYKVILLC